MKQAVILIHGIGEQKPMGTVRGFVETVLSNSGLDEPYFSKPDPMSESMELRKLQGRTRPQTDFFEYYWASHIDGTNFWDVGLWIIDLIRRRKRDVPKEARAIWVVCRVLLIAFLLAIVFGWLAGVKGYIEDISFFSTVGLFTFILIIGFQYAVLFYIGDAARYLGRRPRSIKLRNSIRSDGIKLLRKIHQSGKYDRVILVGHSLGSVIGYDIITHFWQESHSDLPKIGDDKKKKYIRDCMRRRITPQPNVRNNSSMAADRLAKENVDFERLLEFRNIQMQTWIEQRYFGNPWLITDFVTLGSPLVHSMLLMSENAEDFERRRKQRELPTCPPQRDQKGFAYSSPVASNVGEDVPGGRVKKYMPLILHHAAPFAVTRWTNVYFPAKLGFFGDIVGGRLSEYFGDGILDIEAFSDCSLKDKTIISHTRYWASGEGVKDGSVAAKMSATSALLYGLSLNSLKKFRVREPDRKNRVI